MLNHHGEVPEFEEFAAEGAEWGRLDGLWSRSRIL